MNNFQKRILGGAVLGIFFGLLAFWIFTLNPVAQYLPEWTKISFQNPMFLYLISLYFLLGFVVAISGKIVKHPVFGFKIPIGLRGIFFGILVSLPSAISNFLGQGESMWDSFIFTMIFGVFAGFIIDFILTSWFGEGKDLERK